MNDKPVRDVYAHLSNSYGRNHYEIDRPLHQLLTYFSGTVPKLSKLGDFVGKELYEISDYVDKIGNPKIITWGMNGERVDEAWLDPAERWALERLVKEFGVNKRAYRGGNWFDHYTSIYLIADPGLACILTLTNQTAYALFKYGSSSQKKVIASLIGEEEDLEFGATWFTEIQGGSDLGSNVVRANKDKGDKWTINGDTKYFASDAGLADYALVTARPSNGAQGAKGLALFLVPRLTSLSDKNFRITRLKDKSATRNVPTGEVEFRDSEAEVIGEPGKGIYYVMENLTLSRIANSMGALGLARKAYLEAYYFAQKRTSFGKPLIEHPLIQRDLLDMEVWIEGALALALKTIYQFQKSWKESIAKSSLYDYTRILTHISKNLSSEMSSEVTKMAMELHGGIGFLSEFPIERLHREALVTPIWEGGSNIQALDMLEAIGKGAAVTLLEDLRSISATVGTDRDLAQSCLDNIGSTLSLLDSEEAQKPRQDEFTEFIAKDILNSLGHNTATILLLAAGSSLKEPRFTFAGKYYFSRFIKHEIPTKMNISWVRNFIAIDR